MALRRVFEQDSDFKERMFARQIAVMKGQAWNVVETLKTPDHGPLELTRRTRVCVWDDLVDIPVAIPLRSPSAELRAQRGHAPLYGGGALPDEEEMDISTVANGSSSSARLGAAPSALTGDLAHPSRFEISRNTSGSDLSHLVEGPASPATIFGEPFAQGADRSNFLNGTATASRPDVLRKTATSTRPAGGWRRRQSFSRRQADTTGLLYDGDDDDAAGDLGYAAVAGKDNLTRKVIVERLEANPSKNPVFTWC